MDKIDTYLWKPMSERLITKDQLYHKEYSKKDLENITEEQLKTAIYINDLDAYLLRDNINLVRDCFSYEYIYKKNQSTATLFVGIEEIDNRLIFTDKKYFKYNREEKIHDFVTVITIKTGKSIYVLNKLTNKSLFKKYYKERLEDNVFVDINTELPKYIVPKKLGGPKYSKQYEFLNIPLTYKKLFNKKYSFGFELESISGYLPYHLTEQFPYAAVYDGSLKHKDDERAYGLEYVTNVLKGDYGLKTLKFLCIELSKRCIVNNQCSVHLHLGDFKFTKENIVYLYGVLSSVQNELFKWFPIDRQYNEYARQLPILTDFKYDFNDINKSYMLNSQYFNIFKNVGNANIGVRVNKTTDHPYGHKCRYDHSTMRYCWANFVPAIFNTRDNNVYTIEFRIHEANYNYYALKNWLLVCMSFLYVVDNNKAEIHKELKNNTLTMKTVLSLTYPTSTVSSLLNFYKNRAELFKDDKLKVKYEYMPIEDDSLNIKDL